MHRFICRMTAIASLATAAAGAATTDTPAAHAEIRDYGAPYPGERIPILRGIYGRHIADAGFGKAEVIRDLEYGEHPLQRLDLHLPAEPAAGPVPVLVFIHGGAFVRGDKGDGVIFDNVLDYFARHGIAGINANYRLAPEFKWPAGAEDVGGVVRWIRDNADDHGIDADAIFLMGHSAGAVHVATYAFVERLQPSYGDDGVRGAILLSGIYSDANADTMPVYYGDDRTLWKARLPINNVDGRPIPLLVVDAEYDRLAVQLDALALTRAVCVRDGRCPRHVQVPGHNHYSMTYHFNTADESLGLDILAFIREPGGD